MAPVALLYMGVTLCATYLSQARPDSPLLTRPDGLVADKQSLRNVDAIVQQQYPGREISQRRLPPRIPPLYTPDASTPRNDALFDVRPIGRSEITLNDWDPWSDWSLCSRSCGGGVAKRYRRCRKRPPAPPCKGPPLEYILCNTMDCPSRSPSFREAQCSEHGNRLPHFREYDWVPYSVDGVYNCQLYCKAKQLNIIEAFTIVRDGTRCGQDDRHLCIAGECVRVGCDMVVGSLMQEDACGVCGGNNETCFHYKDVFASLPDDAEYFNYNEVTRIPIGATHIVVRDYSQNYLALMEADEHFERYIVNGNRVVSWPGEFETAGTTVVYSRNNGSETFRIRGPTKKDLYIMILYLGREPKVDYEYWIPDSLRPGYNFPYYEYYPDYDPIDYGTVSPQRAPFQLGSSALSSSTTAATTTTVTSTVLTTSSTTSSIPAPTTPTTASSQKTTTTTTRTTTESEGKPPKKQSGPKPRTSTPIGIKAKRCGKCKKPRNRKIYYCQSDFAVHARIISKRRFHHGRNIRYDIEVITTYKSDLKLMDREYVWVPSVCCPKLRPLRSYLIMGRKMKVDITDELKGKKKGDTPLHRRFETRLIVADTDYWAAWKKPYESAMSKVANKLNCQKFMERKGAGRNKTMTSSGNRQA